MKRRTFIQYLGGAGLLSSLGSLKAWASHLKPTDYRMPLLFIGHGNPLNGITDNEFSQTWKKLGRVLPEPKAILCISAHWLTRGVFVTTAKKPKTRHDFSGFTDDLQKFSYPAKPDLTLARDTQSLIKSIPVASNPDFGYDHGCWVVMNHMYPEANIPLVQLSIDIHQEPNFHYELGKELKSLRKKGVIIIGSGNLVHNLSMTHSPEGQDKNTQLTYEYGYDWALEMNDIFKKNILSNNHQALIDYKNWGQKAMLAVPTPDHYYPLLYTLGMQHKNDTMEIFNDKCTRGSLSMTSVLYT